LLGEEGRGYLFALSSLLPLHSSATVKPAMLYKQSASGAVAMSPSWISVYRLISCLPLGCYRQDVFSRLSTHILSDGAIRVDPTVSYFLLLPRAEWK
jgi:hypothetical protein